MTAAKKRRKAVVEESACVACGCCVKMCRPGAIEVVRGTAARVNEKRCVGCGLCARECPASVITLQEVAP